MLLRIKEFSFWKKHDLNYIDASDEVWVLKMPGYTESVGICAEIDYAMKWGKPVKFIECEDYEE